MGGGYSLKRLSILSAMPVLSLLGIATITSSLIFTSISTPSSVSATTSTTGTTSTTSRVAVTLADIISLRILDSTATTDLSDLTLSLTPTPNGAFTKGSFIGEASTSNTTGYKLYLTSIGEDHLGNYTTALINTDSTIPSATGTIPTLPTDSNITEASFRVRNSSYMNRWGYSLNGLTIDSENNITENTDTSTITYADIPEYTEERQIDNKTEATNRGLTPITIGTNTSSAITAGTYKNTLELTAIANPLPLNYSLTFDANTEEAVTNMPEENPMTESSVAAQVSFTIPDVVPERGLYSFKGWNTEPDGSGTMYNAGSTFTIEADSSSEDATSKTLYAIWSYTAFTDTNGHEWTKIVKNSTFANIGSPCPTGYHVPSASEFGALIGVSGTTINTQGTNSENINRLFAAWGTDTSTAYYWSATIYDSDIAYALYARTYDGVVILTHGYKTVSAKIVCTK